jgi:hypothetical protein
VAITELGLTGGTTLSFARLFDVPLDELAATTTGMFAAQFG